MEAPSCQVTYFGSHSQWRLPSDLEPDSDLSLCSFLNTWLLSGVHWGATAGYWRLGNTAGRHLWLFPPFFSISSCVLKIKRRHTILNKISIQLFSCIFKNKNLECDYKICTVNNISHHLYFSSVCTGYRTPDACCFFKKHRCKEHLIIIKYPRLWSRSSPCFLAAAGAGEGVVIRAISIFWNTYSWQLKMHPGRKCLNY